MLLSRPYDALVADVIEAKHVGRGVIDGVETEHLAFRNFDTDWQLWVDVGDKPVPRKLVITSKTVNSAPQYTFRVKSWKTGSAPAAGAFKFVPPRRGGEDRSRGSHRTRRTAAGSTGRRKAMINRKHLLMVGAATALWLCNGGVSTTQLNFIATAGAVVGAPVTPVSYAGVARRSTVGVGAPGVGHAGVASEPLAWVLHLALASEPPAWEPLPCLGLALRPIAVDR